MLSYIILGITAVIFIGGAFYLVNDSRKRGMHIGGKMCGGCPHYCNINKNCDGSEKEKKEKKEKDPKKVSDK